MGYKVWADMRFEGLGDTRYSGLGIKAALYIVHNTPLSSTSNHNKPQHKNISNIYYAIKPLKPDKSDKPIYYI